MKTMVMEKWRNIHYETETMQGFFCIVWGVIFVYPPSNVWNKIDVFAGWEHLIFFKMVFASAFLIIGVLTLVGVAADNLKLRLLMRVCGASIWSFLAAAFFISQYFDTPAAFTCLIHLVFTFKGLRRLARKYDEN